MGTKFFVNWSVPQTVKILNHHGIGMGYFSIFLSKIPVEGRKNQGWDPHGKYGVDSLSDQSCLTFHSPGAEILRGDVRTQAESRGCRTRQTHAGLSVPPLT